MIFSFARFVVEESAKKVLAAAAAVAVAHFQHFVGERLRQEIAGIGKRNARTVRRAATAAGSLRRR